jgi:hypothetical protein
MTGPDHYRVAEKLLDRYGDGEKRSHAEMTEIIAMAQVHATLALAAATAIAPGVSDEVSPDWYAWFSAAGTQTQAAHDA